MTDSLNRPVPFIGVGTGRCGSHTLERIVSACRNVRCEHEHVSIPWYEGSSDPQLGVLIRRFNEDRKSGILSGEIGPCLVRQVPALRSAFPQLKVVCMHRGRDETVKSFLAYGANMPPLRPKEKEEWADSCFGPDKWDSRVPRVFPTIDAASRAQSIRFYWEMYEAMMRSIRQPVFHLHVEALNEPKSVIQLFDFLEIPESDRVFIEVKKFWSIEEAREASKKIFDRYPRA